MHGCSRSRDFVIVREDMISVRNAFLVDHGLLFSLTFLGVKAVAAVYYIRAKKNADVAFKYEEKYTCNYFALFYPEVGTLMSSEHKVIPASFFLE
jgi:hypothetical protein